MINEYELKITEGDGTTMGQGFGVAMHTTDKNTEEDIMQEENWVITPKKG